MNNIATYQIKLEFSDIDGAFKLIKIKQQHKNLYFDRSTVIFGLFFFSACSDQRLDLV